MNDSVDLDQMNHRANLSGSGRLMNKELTKTLFAAAQSNQEKVHKRKLDPLKSPWPDSALIRGAQNSSSRCASFFGGGLTQYYC